jgi:hypothetical protein
MEIGAIFKTEDQRNEFISKLTEENPNHQETTFDNRGQKVETLLDEIKHTSSHQRFGSSDQQ